MGFGKGFSFLTPTKRIWAFLYYKKFYVALILCLKANENRPGNALADFFFPIIDIYMVTVIPEGKEYEFLGWASLGLNKFSMSKTFLSYLMPGRRYRLNANYHGEERAFVVTGQYERVLPMDILPVYLLKAILTEDLDKMEQLGMYEVAPEDMALCEFVCTSKIPVQEIVERGIALMMKELS